MNKIRTRTRTIALSLVLVAAATGAAASAQQAPGHAGVVQATAATTKPAPVAAELTAPTTPTAPVVEAGELDTLRITTAMQDFQLNQAALQQAQNQTEPLRQKLIQQIQQVAATLKLTPAYQWDFQQKRFVRQGLPPMEPLQPKGDIK